MVLELRFTSNLFLLGTANINRRFVIPEQFTVKAHPALFEGKRGERERGKIEEHFPEALT